MHITKSKMLWVTNMPAPYRIQVWDQISKEFDLLVLFSLPCHNWRNWKVPKSASWKHLHYANHYIRIKYYEFPLKFGGLTKIIKSQNIVIVGGWENPFYLSVILLCKIYKIPFFIFYGDQKMYVNPKEIMTRLKRSIFMLSTGIISLSFRTSRNLLAMKIPKDRIVTLFNPYDSRFGNDVHLQEPLSGFHNFIFIGQFISIKAPMELLYAFLEIAGEQDTLTFLGSGPLKNQLERAINDLCVPKQVYVHKQIEPNEVAKFLVNYQTLVLPSRKELWGQVVNEAYSLGLNVVVSENCGVSEHIRGCEGVFICDSKLENLATCLSSAKNHSLELNLINRKLDFTSNSFVKLLVNWMRDKV